MYFQQVPRVNGESGARAYQLFPRSSVLLLDEYEPLVWLKVTDDAGYATITPFEIKEYKPKPVADISSLEERIKRLEERYEPNATEDE